MFDHWNPVAGHLLPSIQWTCAIQSVLEKYLDKLERRGAIADRDRQALLSLPGHIASFPAGKDIVVEGESVSRSIVIASGIVSRVKTIKGGARQIVGLNLPGDAVDLQRVLFNVADHSIHAHTDTVIFSIAHGDILALIDTHKGLIKVLWQDTLVDAAIFREWTVNIGQRRARERIAHLMLELAARFDAVGLLRNSKTYELPLTQRDLADALGMSLVHLNKTIQSLRREGLLSISGREVTIELKERLVQLCGFDSTYLSLDGPGLSAATLETLGATQVAADADQILLQSRVAIGRSK